MARLEKTRSDTWDQRIEIVADARFGDAPVFGGILYGVQSGAEAVAATLEELVAPETAGDPMSAQKWVRSSLRHLSTRLGKVGHAASPPTVGRLLRKVKYSVKANRETGSDHPERDAQFTHIAEQKQIHQDAQLPIISVDTKKKELIGDFKNGGRDWCPDPEVVKVHDFPSEAKGRSVPYGVYDLQRNQGYMRVGTSADTPQFAVESIRGWWEQEGMAAFPDAPGLLVLADAGGSNSCRSRVWKQQLQEQLCDRFGLTVTVCHYPTGCSKWNPVEHRLFGPSASIGPAIRCAAGRPCLPTCGAPRRPPG